MSERIHALAQQLLSKATLEECSVEELQHLTKRYPYFAPAQFLLLQKLKSKGSHEHEKLQQKAVLFYHDPLQFNYFISSDKFYSDNDFDNKSDITRPADESIETAEETAAEITPGKQTVPEEIAFLQTGLTVPETTNEPIAEGNDFIQQENDRLENAGYNAVVPGTGKAIVHEPVSFPEERNLTEIDSETGLADRLPLEEKTDTPADDSFPKNHEDDKQTAGVDKQPDVPSIPENKPETGEKIPTDYKPAITQPSDNGEVLAFEPFHTVDYFASQGIKITAEEMPKDKLSKQLRSFTEWLKTMKRLPATDIAASLHSTDERKVENMASHSVEESEVVTEAMAEVWAKQGAKAKAIETYNKLSLLNPSKNAYFAARIENLKGS